jgi:hypothetical protein
LRGNRGQIAGGPVYPVSAASVFPRAKLERDKRELLETLAREAKEEGEDV